MSIESIHAEIVSGDPSVLRADGELLTRQSRRVDDASRGIVDGMTGVVWPEGLASVAFFGWSRVTFVNTSLAGWRLFRCGSVVDDAATAYREHIDRADDLLRQWRALSQAQRDHFLTEAMFTIAMLGVRSDWSAWLGDAVDNLQGEDGLAKQQEWLERGAAQDFGGHVAHGTNLGPRIPNSILNSGEHWVQQGLAYDRGSDNYLMSSHRHEDPGDYDSNKESGLTLIDRGTGAERKSLDLTSPGGTFEPNHSGGVAVQGDDVYVVSTEVDGPYVYRYSMQEIREARDGGSVPAVTRTRIPVDASSYISTAGGQIWLGRFQKPADEREDDEPGSLYSVDPDTMRAWERGDTSSLPDEIETPAGVNGVHVTNEAFTFARNNGRAEPSELITQNRITGEQQGETLMQGNLIEEIAPAGPDLTTLNEAGAYKYDPTAHDTKDPDDLWGQTHMTDIPRGSADGSVEVETQSLRSASAEFADVEDVLSSVDGAIDGVVIGAWSLGGVDGAGTFTSAVNQEVVKAADEVRDAEQQSASIFSGLRDTAAGYDLSDLEIASGLGVLTGLLGGG